MLRANVAVALAAVCFGTTFGVVQGAVAHVSPESFIAVRFLIAGAVLLGLARRRRLERGVVGAGLACGVPLLAGFLLQTIGLRHTTTSVSAFVTYLLVVMVPVMSAFVLRRLPSPAVVAGVVAAAVGLGLLTAPRGGFGLGAALTLGSAFAFALNIVLLGRWAPRFDPVQLTVVQLLVVGLGSVVPGALTGGYRFGPGPLLAAVYTALVPTALAVWLQVWGQRRVGPTRTSLLLMLEPVTAALIGYGHGERLGPAGLLGAGLILLGIAVAEVGPGRLTTRTGRMKLVAPASGAGETPDQEPSGRGRAGAEAVGAGARG